MTVKIITDSLGDLPEDVTKNLGITVIPIYVLFGTESFKDGVDLTNEQFYKRLVESKTLPTTAVPALGDFISVFEKAAEEADELLVITISHKLSGTYETANRAADMVKQKVKIKVIDSLHVVMGEGLLVIRAAEAAKEGARLDEIVKLVKSYIPRSETRMAFDTLEYLKRGGRIGAAQAFLGSILKVNPVLGLKDGEVYPVARERSRSKALESLYNFAAGYTKIEAFAVEDATTPEEADKLAERLHTAFPDVPLYRSKVGAVIGAHVGPSVIAVSLIGDR